MITAILNCYRRPDNLQIQIESLLSQSIPPKEIWVWKNYHQDINNFDWDGFCLWADQYNIKIVESNYNWKYCGRFSLACLVDTEYTAIFDDDTIPGERWFENCLETMKKTPGILGGVGVSLKTDYSYQPNTRYGWVSGNEDAVEVDLVGHAWFFPAEYIKYMWMEKPTWENGEDMHFSAMCQIHGNIKTYAAPHPKSNMSVWSSLHGIVLGVDEVASSAVRNHEKFYRERNAVVERLRNYGWKLHKDK